MPTPNWHITDEAFWALVQAVWEERKSGQYSSAPSDGPWHPTDLATQITTHIEDVAATLVSLGEAGMIDSGHRLDGHHLDCPREDVDKGSTGE